MKPTYENGIWKGGKVDMPDGYFKIGERILNQLKKYPDFVGQIDGTTGKKDTYQSMSDRSIKCALWLKTQGVNRGDVIGYCSKNHLDSCIFLFASFYIGAIFNPWWDTCLGEELVMYFIKTTQPKAIFVDENFAEIITKSINKMNYSLPIIVFGEKNGLLSFKDILRTQTYEEVSKFKCTKVESKDPALLIYTSGSTSFPKGVLHSHHSVAHMFNYYSNDATPSTVLWFSGLCWISGTRTVLRSIIFKATMVVSDNLTEEEACRVIEKYKITRLWLGTPVLNRFTKVKEIDKYDLSSVELVTYGGGSPRGKVIENSTNLFKNADIYARYGSTESGTVLAGRIRFNKFNSCGKIFFNAEVKVIDVNTKEILGPNREGELCFRTPKLMIGYWNNPAETQKVIDSKGWYHSGDLGYYDEEGDFFINDRMRDTIRCYLFNVRPGAIEDVIQDLPGVAEVAVIAKPNFDYLEVPMAFVTKVPGLQVTEEEIIEVVEKKLSDGIKLLGGVCFLDKMPYTHSKKIAKNELRVIAKTLSFDNS